MADITPVFMVVALLAIATGLFLFLYSYAEAYLGAVDEYNVLEKGMTLVSTANGLVEECIEGYLADPGKYCIEMARVDFDSPVNIAVYYMPTGASYIRLTYNDATYEIPTNMITAGTSLENFGLTVYQYDPRNGTLPTPALTIDSLYIAVAASFTACTPPVTIAEIQDLFNTITAKTGEVPVLVVYACPTN